MKIQLPLVISQVLSIFEQHSFEAYVVGGSVRDMLLDQSVTDWDLTTNATPEQIQGLFPESFYDNGFGTVGITVQHLLEQFSISPETLPKDLPVESVVEITTFRTEGSYSDNRRPDTVTWGTTLKEDVQRRDYTINAMAICLTSSSTQTQKDYELVDYFNGKQDLTTKTLRAVGDPNTRFTEDALRMLRGIRLAAQLGFMIETKTLTAIGQQAALLGNISWERKRDELLKLVVTPHSADGLKLMLSTSTLDYVLPELLESVGVAQGGHHTKDVWHHSIDSMQACPSPDPIVKLASLLHDVGKPRSYRKKGSKITFYGHEVIGGRMVKKIGRRLHLSNRNQERLYTLVRHHMFLYEPHMTDAAIRRFIKRVGLNNVNDMIMLRIGDRVGGGAKQTSWRLREFQQRIGQVLYTPMQVKDLNVNGKDVMDTLQISSGPQVGKILNTLFEEVMEDSSKNDREYLLKRITAIGKTQTSDD